MGGYGRLFNKILTLSDVHATQIPVENRPAGGTD